MTPISYVEQREIQQALNPELCSFLPEKFEALIRKYAPDNVNVSLEYGYTPITLAATFNNVEAMKYLITRKPPANVNKMMPNSEHDTVLSCVVGKKNYDLIKLLLTHNANVDFNACLSAASTGDIEIVTLLLPYINWKPTQYQLDKLLITSISGDATKDVVDFLLEFGASASAEIEEEEEEEEEETEKKYETAITAAIINKKPDILKLLIDKGGDKNRAREIFDSLKKDNERMLRVLLAIIDKVGSKTLRNSNSELYQLAGLPHDKVFIECIDSAIQTALSKNGKEELLEQIKGLELNIDYMSIYISELNAEECSGVKLIEADPPYNSPELLTPENSSNVPQGDNDSDKGPTYIECASDKADLTSSPVSIVVPFKDESDLGLIESDLGLIIDSPQEKDNGVFPENSNSNKITIFSTEEKEQILTALTESIKSIKRFPMIGDWDKTNKVDDLEIIKKNIVDNINTENSEQIKEMLKKFAAKANEYRLTKKTTTSFQMFKKKIGTILSKEDIDGIETIDQKRYQRLRPK